MTNVSTTVLSQSEDEDDCSTVVKTSVTVDNSPIQDYVHLGDHTQPIYNSIFFDHFFFRQGHAAAIVDKKVYIFGGSSGSGFGGQHSDSTSDPIYLNDLFLLKGMQRLYRNRKC